MLGLFECKPFNVKSIAKKILPYCIIVLIYLIFVQNIFNIEATESKDIQSATFSINYMKVLLPLFLKALLSINYFSITVYLFIVVTAFYFFSTRKDSKKLLSLMILFLAYIALYTFHYRGFYFVTYGKVSIFESFRYLNNCYVIIPVSIALSMKWICSKVSMRVLSSFLGVLLVFSIVQTYILRTNLSEKEQENRWKDVKTVLSFIGDDNDNDKKVLISEDILLYQNECSPSFAVLDIRLINEVKVDKSIKKYLVLKDTDARYKVKIKSDSLKLITPLVNGGLYEY